MDWIAVLERIEGGEREETEFKRDLDFKKIKKTIAAFANTTGGVVILGVSDDGMITGLQGDSESIQEKLTSFLQTGLSAPVQAALGRQHSPDGWVHWIKVPRQRGYEPMRYSGQVYVRRARSSVEPSPAELADLYNGFGYIVTEERAIEGTNTDHVDMASFKNYLARLGLELDAEPRIELADDLRARGVVTDFNDNLVLTVYGALSFGRTPQAFPQTQNFFVQCTSYQGADRAAPVLEVIDAKGRLDEQVDRVMTWAASQPRRELYSGADRHDIPRIPVAAMREAVVNAVAHRDYAIINSKVLIDLFSDRIEITSPGRFTNGLTPASVTRGGNPRARNQSITNYLLTMGKMEQRGRGWPIIAKAMRDHNDTEPVLEEDRDARWVRVTLYTDVGAHFGDYAGDDQ